MHVDDLKMELRKEAAAQPPVNGDLSALVQRARRRRLRRRLAASCLTLSIVVFAVMVLTTWGTGRDKQTVTADEPGAPEPPVPITEPAARPPDPELQDYREAVASTIECLDGLGYNPVIGPWPESGGRQYSYDYGIPEEGETPELRAAADRCYEANEQSAQRTIANRDGPTEELQEELLDVLDCMRSELSKSPLLTDDPTLPATIDDLNALSVGASARLSGAISGVLLEANEGLIPNGEATKSCVAAAVAVPD